MSNHTFVKSLIAYARVAGLAYVINLLIGIFNVSLIDASIIVPGDDAATASNMMTNELRFRIRVASEVEMYALVILLSLAQDVILKEGSQNIGCLGDSNMFVNSDTFFCKHSDISTS